MAINANYDFISGQPWNVYIMNFIDDIKKKILNNINLYIKRIQTISTKEPSSCLYKAYDVLQIASSFKHYFHLVISNIGQKVVEFVWQNTYGANLDFQINYCLPQ